MEFNQVRPHSKLCGMMENLGSYQLVGPLPDSTVESRQFKLSYFQLADNSTLHAGPVQVPSLKRLPITCTRHYSNTFLVPLELDLTRFHCITCNAWFDLSLHLLSLEAPLSLDLSKHLGCRFHVTALVRNAKNWKACQRSTVGCSRSYFLR